MHFAIIFSENVPATVVDGMPNKLSLTLLHLFICVEKNIFEAESEGLT